MQKVPELLDEVLMHRLAMAPAGKHVLDHTTPRASVALSTEIARLQDLRAM